ncbi:MAG TPA: pyridoxamine 5'-phosphate oxidase [Acidimicrobiia bacterium]|nr:pyridoxamine 5'-phosphate oxidase [Acidimicrobiia bacterium]
MSVPELPGDSAGKPGVDSIAAPAVSWGEFAAREPELARFGAGRLTAGPAYLATVRRSGRPRVHPVTPIFTTLGLFLFMEPTSPKRKDLLERRWFALHSGVPDNEGTGGEFWMNGHGVAVESSAIRADGVEAAGYSPADRYVLFELRLREARANGYGDVVLPSTSRWSVGR